MVQINRIASRIAYIIGISITICSCTKVDEDNFKIYTIEKDDQVCQIQASPLIEKSIHITGRFDETCIYNLGNENQLDWNKLDGFGDNDPHINSARVGFRWNIENQEMELSTYVYDNGHRSFEKVTSVKINEDYDVDIDVAPNQRAYVYNINGIQKIVGVTNIIPLYAGIRYHPYFGGQESAPHRMDIRIKDRN